MMSLGLEGYNFHILCYLLLLVKTKSQVCVCAFFFLTTDSQVCCLWLNYEFSVNRLSGKHKEDYGSLKEDREGVSVISTPQNVSAAILRQHLLSMLCAGSGRFQNCLSLEGPIWHLWLLDPTLWTYSKWTTSCHRKDGTWMPCRGLTGNQKTATRYNCFFSHCPIVLI